MNQRVAVIGTGRMGSALAAALMNKGFVTTVWNRTVAKTEPLSGLGVRIANIAEAVGDADVVIVNVNNYDSTMQLLRRPEMESALRGKILVQLSSGTPDEARGMQSWARPLAIEYLDGAIMSYPVGIGKPEGTVLYSGSEQLFEHVKPVLLAFGECHVCRRRNRPRLGARCCRSHLGHERHDRLPPGIRRLRRREPAGRPIHATCEGPDACFGVSSYRPLYKEPRKRLWQSSGGAGNLGSGPQRGHRLVQNAWGGPQHC